MFLHSFFFPIILFIIISPESKFDSNRIYVLQITYHILYRKVNELYIIQIYTHIYIYIYNIYIYIYIIYIFIYVYIVQYGQYFPSFPKFKAKYEKQGKSWPYCAR